MDGVWRSNGIPHTATTRIRISRATRQRQRNYRHNGVNRNDFDPPQYHKYIMYLCTRTHIVAKYVALDLFALAA